MAKLILKQGKGFTKEEAAKNCGFTAPVVYEATVAYKRAQEDTNQVFDLKEFAKNYVQGKVKGVENIGFFIKLEAPVKNTRLQPYSVDNHATKEIRKYQTFYELVDSDNKIYGTAESKAESEVLGKQLVTQFNRDFTSRLVKLPVQGDPIAIEFKFTPSVGTKEGSFIFFSLEGDQ